LQRSFDLSAFKGQTIFVSFAVNNDGIGGRTTMVVDDVSIAACNPGPAPATATPTNTPLPTLTPTGTTTPFVTAVPPIITVPPPGPGCIQLLHNNGFEAGFFPWEPGRNELPAQIVTWPVLSGASSLGMGALNQNLNSFSSARQWVVVPATHPHVVVSFWTFTRAESLWGTDRQQFVVLGPGDVVLAAPWKVLQNAQVWQPQQFALNGLAGQTIAIYFNAINDGKGGRTSLFVDEVYLWACTPGANPVIPMPLMAAGATTGAGSAPSVQVAAITPAAAGPERVEESIQLPSPQPTAFVAEQVTPQTGIQELQAAATSTPESTRIALQPPTQIFAGETVATDTPAPLLATPEVRASGRLAEILARWQPGWQQVVLAIVGALIVVVVLILRPDLWRLVLVAVVAIVIIIIIVAIIRR
jgi:hypothetical protein